MVDRVRTRRATKLARSREIEAGRGGGMAARSEAPIEHWRQMSARLVGDLQLTALDIERQTGIPMERLRELWRALGFPPVAEDHAAFSQADVEVLARVGQLQREELAGDDVLLQLVRVSGQALARIAETEVELFVRPDAATTETEVATVMSRLTAMEPFLRYIWRRHLAAAVARKLLAGEVTAGENVLTVGFADLVGFTDLARKLEAPALAEAVDRFERNVYRAVPGHNGRVIKMLGDEVMFAASAAADGADIALALVDLHRSDPLLPPIRAGLSRGPVLAWEGDLFGTTVNLASRLAEVARPSTVLASSEMIEALSESDAHVAHRSHRFRLKGLGTVRACRLGRAEE